MRGFFRDFRLFVARGNVLDLAVAVVIGAAFGSITTSLVDDVLMPPLGYLIGGVDFQALVLRLNDSVVVRYGAFLNTVVNFVIVAFAMFLVVRGVSAVQNLRRKEAETEEAEALPLEVALLTEIRDLLAAERPPGRRSRNAVAVKSGGGQSPQKVRPADQDLRPLQAALYLAQALGAQLGKRPLLFGALPPRGETRIAHRSVRLTI